jgi:V/A-type H+-transporting ATPase subunit D
MTEKYKDALEKINIARINNSDLDIKSASIAVQNTPIIDVESKNIMGVVVPNISHSNIKKNIFSRGYGLHTSADITRAADTYEELLEFIIMVAEVETSMLRLLEEIDKTKRRVNALEYEVIPKLQKAKKFIEIRLEEQERETVFRSKIIKNKN